MAWTRRITRTLLKCGTISAMLFWYISPAAAKVTTLSALRADVPAHIRMIWPFGNIFKQTGNCYSIWIEQGRVKKVRGTKTGSKLIFSIFGIVLGQLFGIVLQVTCFPIFWLSDPVKAHNYRKQLISKSGLLKAISSLFLNVSYWP